MRILVSNDDGVDALGIRTLARVMSEVGEVYVVAPDRNRSGASNSLTLTRPLRIRELENGYYSVDGTPTDCVHLALTGFLKNEMNIVVSGLNAGANLGDDVLYSGTVAAAMEGRYLGLPAIAFSMVATSDKIECYNTGAIVAKQLVMQLINSNSLPSKTILNVNIPDIPINKIRGIEVTRLGERHGAEPLVPSKDPRNRSIYWIGSPGLAAEAGPGTDFYAVSQNYVSITPLQLDMTHYKVFDQLSTWAKNIYLES